MAERSSVRPALIMNRAVLINARVTRGFSFHDEPTVNSQDEMSERSADLLCRSAALRGLI